MRLAKESLLFPFLKRYPFLVEHLIAISPLYSRLKDGDMADAMASVATIEMASSLGGMEPEALMEAIASEVKRRTGEVIEISGAGKRAMDDARVDELKEIVKELHKGWPVEAVRERFLSLARRADASEIARMEQSLMDEGIPEEEIKRLCDVHVDVFRTSLDGNEAPKVPPGHPVDTYMKENRALEDLLSAISPLISKKAQDKVQRLGAKDERTALNLLDSISNVELHYLRKENQLFPLLEMRGVKGPSKVMWALHDDIRKMVKEARAVLEKDGLAAASPLMLDLTKVLKDMIYKEEKVLFPMAMERLSPQDWSAVRRGEEEIGYAWVKPSIGWEAPPPDVEQERTGAGPIPLKEGRMTTEQLDAVLRTLPLDISFVDENDRVAYYSASDDRIFPRSPAVIGREVRNCHPPKSVHVVERILNAFKEGSNVPAEFWIELHGRFLHIRYLPVRNGEGRYLGTLEVTQDVTAIRKLSGERRLLDWG